MTGGFYAARMEIKRRPAARYTDDTREPSKAMLLRAEIRTTP